MGIQGKRIDTTTEQVKAALRARALAEREGKTNLLSNADISRLHGDFDTSYISRLDKQVRKDLNKEE
jgi:hypothetical protein